MSVYPLYQLANYTDNENCRWVHILCKNTIIQVQDHLYLKTFHLVVQSQRGDNEGCRSVCLSDRAELDINRWTALERWENPCSVHNGIAAPLNSDTEGERERVLLWFIPRFSFIYFSTHTKSTSHRLSESLICVVASLGSTPNAN